MNVNKTLETPSGTLQFSGELTQEESDFVIKIGLNYLLQQGMLPVMGGSSPNEEFDD